MSWLPIFTRPKAVEIIFESWRYLQRERQFRLFGYVILENHLYFKAAADALAALIRNFKSFTAKQIIHLLEQHAAEVLLRQLRANKLRPEEAKEPVDYASRLLKAKRKVWKEKDKPE